MKRVYYLLQEFVEEGYLSANVRRHSRRSRVQLDLQPAQEKLLEYLESQLAARSRADLLQESIGMLFWYVQETSQGRKVVSISPDDIGKLGHVVELMSPTTVLANPNVYRHLVSRPHPWRRQLSLKGRNMTVGQLIGTMNAESMTPEQAADRLDLPLEQVQEAVAYYEANKELVNSEFREEKRRLQAKGFARVSPPVSG